MKIVIDIPENDYELALRNDYSAIYKGAHIAEAIKKGIPLPKHHGRLKDVDVFLSKVKADREHSAYSGSWTADDVLTALDNSYAPTIIEAESDKESKR